VSVDFLKSVVLYASLTACTTPSRDSPAPARDVGSAAPVANRSGGVGRAASPSAGASAAGRPAPEPSATESALPESATGSAYFGCGAPVPAARLWDETTESQVLEAISVAKTCAAEHGRRVLLEFVAPWCGDCHEMARVESTPLVESVMRSRYERVRINVGKWDRHEGLRRSYEVKALATYVVIDPTSSKLIAKTTLEPITGKRGKVSPEQWAEWLSRH
jgi:hypothetical protein